MTLPSAAWSRCSRRKSCPVRTPCVKSLDCQNFAWISAAWLLRGYAVSERRASQPVSTRAGIDKAGKTTLLERLKTMYGATPGTPPERILPTVGLNVGRMQARTTVWEVLKPRTTALG